jgi:hypothetical protein
MSEEDFEKHVVMKIKLSLERKKLEKKLEKIRTAYPDFYPLSIQKEIKNINEKIDTINNELDTLS